MTSFVADKTAEPDIPAHWEVSKSPWRYGWPVPGSVVHFESQISGNQALTGNCTESLRGGDAPVGMNGDAASADSLEAGEAHGHAIVKDVEILPIDSSER
ncbi:hypothetical protein AAHB34_05355 [Paenarthrobacter ureafaciens]